MSATILRFVDFNISKDDLRLGKAEAPDAFFFSKPNVTSLAKQQGLLRK